MKTLEKIKERFEAWKHQRSTSPLPPDDIVWLIKVSELASELLSSSLNIEKELFGDEKHLLEFGKAIRELRRTLN